MMFDGTEKLKKEIEELRKENDSLKTKVNVLKNRLRSAAIPNRTFILTMKINKKKYALGLTDKQLLHKNGRRISLFEVRKGFNPDNKFKFQFVFFKQAMILRSFATDFCFDVANASNFDPPEGTLVYLSKAHANLNQRFSHYNGRIIAIQNGQCVTFYPNEDYPFVMMKPNKQLDEYQLIKIKYLD